MLPFKVSSFLSQLQAKLTDLALERLYLSRLLVELFLDYTRAVLPRGQCGSHVVLCLGFQLVT